MLFASRERGEAVDRRKRKEKHPLNPHAYEEERESLISSRHRHPKEEEVCNLHFLLTISPSLQESFVSNIKKERNRHLCV